MMQEFNIGQFLSRNQKLITHPDNYHKIKDQLKINQYPEEDVFVPFVNIEIITNHLLPKEKDTGRIVNPDGTISEREGYQFNLDRFTIVEEQDLPWLLHFEYVKPEKEMLIYIIDDNNFRIKDYWYQNNATVYDPKLTKKEIK